MFTINNASFQCDQSKEQLVAENTTYRCQGGRQKIEPRDLSEFPYLDDMLQFVDPETVEMMYQQACHQDQQEVANPALVQIPLHHTTHWCQGDRQEIEAAGLVRIPKLGWDTAVRGSTCSGDDGFIPIPSRPRRLRWATAVHEWRNIGDVGFLPTGISTRPTRVAESYTSCNPICKLRTASSTVRIHITQRSSVSRTTGW